MRFRVDSLTILRALQTAMVIHLMDLGWSRDLMGMGYAGISVNVIIGWLFYPNVLAFILYWGMRPRWQMGSLLYGLLLSMSMAVVAFALFWTGYTILMMVVAMIHAGLLFRLLYLFGRNESQSEIV